ncbi:peptidoglycan-recognition protein LB-like isoform X1 [Diorhabda sublineata]|uniref:peptidoglycan-recognition protein LB-like isoform X1 n=1 Tax=Diorhabda sublineata TaxID=1163346 RepID=UPI0024E12E57|nr:peptidoglycan-recognition protein LB-like isoform X1 [Diorhabda sublineata]
MSLYFFKVIFWSVLVDSVSLTSDPTIVTREEWQAKPPKYTNAMINPVPYVVIHHSYQPPACYNLEDCIKAMKWMQDFHQNTRGWADIGYSFAVGSDGRAYVGRGWSCVGAHAPLYNNRSIGICLIGDWRVELPPEQQLTTVKQLIEMGVREGYIQSNYKLVGHKQVREGTECPGDRLYKEIITWSHYFPDPQEIAYRNRSVDVVVPQNVNKDIKNEDDNDENKASIS